MAITCPNCSYEMRQEDFEGVKLDVCPNCGGTWFDPDELRALLAKDPQVQNRLISETKPHLDQMLIRPSHLLCPINQVLLDVYHYMYDSPIELHTCSHCGGFWIAAGAVESINEWRERAHGPLTPKEEAGILLGEATIEHERVMTRLENLTAFANVMRYRAPGWIGLIP